MHQSVVNLIRSTVPRPLRNALRRPRTTARRVIAKSQFLLGRRAEMSLRPDWRLRCHPLCVPEFSVFVIDPLQQDELDCFVRRCYPAMRLLDVGAHWGIFTLAAMHYGGAGVRSVCLEPSADAAAVMRWNFQLNGIADRVKIIERAAGQTAGALEMLSTGAGGADYMVVAPEPRPDSVAITQVDIAGLCASLDFIPTHIKMDIEGYEEEGLLGALPILEQHRPCLFLELHGDLIRRRQHDPREVVRTLSAAGYEIRHHNEALADLDQLAAAGFNARLLCAPKDRPGS
jgi:FkbM family methyltransferase